MEKHICKLCLRRFSNGRALGGHMRSHVIYNKQQQPPPPQPNSPSSSSSSYEAERKPQAQGHGAYYGLRENPRKSVRLVDPEFSSIDHACYGNSLSAVVQDRESETESSPNSAKRRRRGQRPRADELEPVSSVSNTTPDEDVALCLVMLSRDAWSREGEFENGKGGEESDGGDGENEEDDEEEGIVAVRSKRGGRGRYRCETCKRTFGSYQALGGHRASHKKVRASEEDESYPRRGQQIRYIDSEVNGGDAKIHECPFCFRVFPSGQALGGHKRSHLAGSASSARAVASNSLAVDRKDGSFIDLNLPAPMEDVEDGSQVEYSAVSNAEL